jgi:hypothetical protein
VTSYQPTDVRTTYNEANNTVDVSWTPRPSFDSLHQVGQVLSWTTNPNDLSKCNYNWSENPCHSVVWDYSYPPVSSYSIPYNGSNIYVKVETIVYATFWLEGASVRKGSFIYNFEDCPNTYQYGFYPPVCWLTPESAEIMAGESAVLTMNNDGGTIDEARFESSNTGAASVTSPDSAAPYETTVSGVGGGTATVTGRTYIGSTNVCTDTATITVTGSAEAWWQVVDGNVYAESSSSNNPDLRSELPICQDFRRPPDIGVDLL